MSMSMPQNGSNGGDMPPLCMQWASSQTVGVGFSNRNSTCYLNSVLQCLIHLPPLAQLAQEKYHRCASLSKSCRSPHQLNQRICYLFGVQGLVPRPYLLALSQAMRANITLIQSLQRLAALSA